MQRPRLAALRLVARLADAVVLAATYALVLAIRVSLGEVGPLPPMEFSSHLGLLALILPAWLVMLEWLGTYRALRRARFVPLFSGVLRASAAATVAVVMGLYALKLSGSVSRTLVFGFGVASVPTLLAARYGMIAAARRFLSHPAERVLLVGEPGAARSFAETVTNHPEWGLAVVGLLTRSAAPSPVPVLGVPDALEHVLDQTGVDHVLAVGLRDLPVLRGLADACEKVGVRFSMDANFLGLTTARAHLDDLDGWRLLTFSSTPAHAEALVVKRVMDMAVAATGLLLAAPLLGLVALAIKVSDGGPVLFTQTRCGLYGRPFTLHKFRSMHPDAEAWRPTLELQSDVDGPAFKMRRDPRVTRVGAWLRRTSLDELPQLYDVLRGHMSLVGPRPPLPAEVARYERWQLRRLSMRPGITCIWQVSGRNRVDFDTWMRLDLEYIDNWTLGLDLRLLLRTIPAVLRGAGAW